MYGHKDNSINCSILETTKHYFKWLKLKIIEKALKTKTKKFDDKNYYSMHNSLLKL